MADAAERCSAEAAEICSASPKSRKGEPPPLAPLRAEVREAIQRGSLVLLAARGSPEQQLAPHRRRSGAELVERVEGALACGVPRQAALFEQVDLDLPAAQLA